MTTTPLAGVQLSCRIQVVEVHDGVEHLEAAADGLVAADRVGRERHDVAAGAARR